MAAMIACLKCAAGRLRRSDGRGHGSTPTGLRRLRFLVPVEPETLLLGVALLGLATGVSLAASGRSSAGELAWTIATLPALLALLLAIVTSFRAGRIGLDIVAALSMSSALVFGEPLAANVVALMYAGGQRLEAYAQGRARKEMTALLGRVARTALRYRGEQLEQVDIADLQPGERILIRQGEVVPVDGTVVQGMATLDQSALTGEAYPVSRRSGEDVASGSTAIGAPFDLAVLRTAAHSTYAGIVRLVETAQASRAPMVRLADRYSLGFLAFTLLTAGMAWLATGDAHRLVAVLVVATPCPLILAVPVALVAGLSRAAGRGVLVKGGGALEALAKVEIAVLDKTGTLTQGRAALIEIQHAPSWSPENVLRLAASLDQASGHVVAAALVEAAHARSLDLSRPTDVRETPGTGICGTVEGHRLAVGSAGFLRDLECRDNAGLLERQQPPGTTLVAVAIDSHVAGILIFADTVREDAADVVAALRAGGIREVILASGDRKDVVEALAKRLRLDRALAELEPQGKVAVVLAARRDGKVMMIGDGVNDAPALAAADVGIAMGASGAAAASEAADVVVLVDRLDRLVEAMAMARRARAIAQQSVIVGLGLSACAMFAAALGYLPPVAGALLQEAIDVAVILNALRALRP